MDTHYVYALVDRDNNQSYIGVMYQPESRSKHHSYLIKVLLSINKLFTFINNVILLHILAIKS